MAKISMRDLFRIRLGNTIFTHHRRSILVSPNQNNLFLASYSYSFPYVEDRPFSIYHPSIEFVKLCQNSGHLFQIQSQLITSGLFPFWSAKLLKYYSDFGDIDSTISIFKYIDSPGPVVVNNVIKAYSLSSIPQRALLFYFDMVANGCFPNSYTFVSLLSCCAKLGCAKSGQMCHGQALKNGVDSTLPVQNSLIHFYGCCSAVEHATKVFDEMSQRDLVSWNSIISANVSRGDLVTAHNIFEVMLERNVISWNIMINGYLKVNNPGCALLVFRKMANRGLQGNLKTMVGVIRACGKSARLREGRSVHGYLIRKWKSLSIFIYTSLIDMYSKCRRVELASKIFDSLMHRNLICWNAMILGHCIHGKPEDGLNLFADMVEAIEPDEVTYIGILSACARAGLLTEGRNFFSQMTHKYCLKPNFAHYWCMANLYAGLGLVNDAENVLRNMPVDNENVSLESIVWANLLTVTRFQANATLGERVAKSLIAKEPWNFSHYQLLANVYAAASKWEDVARVKEMLKKGQMRRNPGCNLVDLKKIVHEYRVGHCWQEGIDEMTRMIGEVAEKPIS